MLISSLRNDLVHTAILVDRLERVQPRGTHGSSFPLRELSRPTALSVRFNTAFGKRGRGHPDYVAQNVKMCDQNVRLMHTSVAALLPISLLSRSGMVCWHA